MISKADSLKIFVIVTITAMIIFILLSYNTLKLIPEQTNEKNITPSVIRGKNIWESNNCMGCHTIFGEGAYYAPELTTVYLRKSEEFLKMFLKDPNAMYPNKRKMIKYNFSEAEIDDIISFLKWCSEVDLNGFPPEPFLKNLTSNNKINTIDTTKKPEIFDKLCLTCHTYNGNGNKIADAPILDDIYKIRDKEYLIKWLKDPKSIKENSLMPKFPLSDSTIEEIVEFLVK